MAFLLASSADCSDSRKPVTTTSCMSPEPAAVCDCGLVDACCALTPVHRKITGNDVAVTAAARAARRARLWTRCDINVPPESGFDLGGGRSARPHDSTVIEPLPRTSSPSTTLVFSTKTTSLLG